MSKEIETFVDHFVAELKEENAAVFVGAGLSVASGVVDWHELLQPLANELGLDVDRENDLVALAQYHFNEHQRHKLNQRLISEFSAGHAINENHRILARLPIRTFWTTNYDRLIEEALSAAGRRPDVKYTVSQLALTKPRRDAIVYKMHGDVEHPDKAVLIKDDYERYYRDWGPFINALGGDLVSRTFLFLGFSFTDPHLDHVLSRIRFTFEGSQREHYFITRRRSRKQHEGEDQYKYAVLQQDFKIKDLRRYNIRAIVVDEYEDITSILRLIERRFARRTILISGSAASYGDFPDPRGFLEGLSGALIETGYKIVTGFGLGVGSDIITGGLQRVYGRGGTLHDEMIFRPFPQGENAQKQWENYRKDMVAHAGCAIFVFGNKLSGNGNEVVNAGGVRAEFELARAGELDVIPIGATGFMAEELWREVMADVDRYYPGADSELRSALESLGDRSAPPKAHIEAVLRILQLLNRKA